jgi:mono/diheme cytochrome c family protein
MRNPVTSSAASLAAGKRVFDNTCAPCHGNAAQGAAKAGTPLSIIEEQHGRQPPDLTDAAWDHGSSDGEIFNVIARGVPPTMMPAFSPGIPDADIWHVFNYLRSLAPRR